MLSCQHDHIHLTSSDPEETVRFYTQIMGAQITNMRESGGRKIVDINLGGIPVRISNGTGADGTWDGLQLGLHHLGFIVNDMEEAFQALQSKGVDFVVEPTQPRPGVKTAFIRAPNDVLIELIEVAHQSSGQ